MKSNYIDRYYNHFSRNIREDHNPLKKEKNYLMRFQTFLPYSFSKQQSSFSVIYSNSISPMNLITAKGSSKLKRNHFSIINPNTDWEFLCKEEERVDVLSFILSKKLMSEFCYYVNSKETDLLDTPFEINSYDSFFIENNYKADYNHSGRFLKNIFDISNTEEYKFLDPNEIVFELLGILYNEQLEYNVGIKNIKGKKESTKREVFKRIMVAYEYIHDTFENKKIDIIDLSQVSGLSEYHIYSSFKSIYQKTPHQYINYLRMLKAKQYINCGKMTISEISDKLQFPDLPTFSKLFKKTYGINPSKLIYN